MSKSEQVLIVCNEDDEYKDIMINRMALLQAAMADNNLVIISCHDKEKDKPAMVLAVISKDSGNDILEYAPIGILYHPDDDSFFNMVPPPLLTTEDNMVSNAKH